MPFEQSAWSLDDLFPQGDATALEAAFSQLEAEVEAFAARRAQLQPDIAAETFLSFLQAAESLTRQLNRLYAFAGLSFAANTQDQQAQALLGRVQQFAAEMQNRTLFFELWWKNLDEENVARLLAVAGDYRYYLEKMRAFKPHTLSEAEERVVNLKNVTGTEALVNLYDAITNRYTFDLDVDGETRSLTRGELMTYARDPNPNLRAAAYQVLYHVYGEDGPILGQIYQAIVRDWRNEQLQLRGFASPIAARNLRNDIPDEAVDALLDASRRNATLFQRYFRLKARHLGMETLRRYDIYAPVVAADKRYSFEQAAEIVLDSFRQFSPRFAALAETVFQSQHIDSEVRPGKQGGAFCWSVTPDLTPWVKLNYQGRAADVATMAHELGHAIHSMLAAEHSVFTFHASLPLAETASTFGEMMLIDRLLAEETDDAVRRDLLFRQVDDAYATIMRQAFFAIFERQAHEMIAQNASVDALAEAYLDNLHDQFGDAVQLSDEFRWEWVSIPHIYHTPFYVYAYAFGQLLVLALYKRYQTEGEAFKPQYENILRAGGSAAPEHILRQAGIEIRDPAFWQGGFDIIAEMIERLEAFPVA